MFSKSGVMKTMHSYRKGRVHYHILFSKGNYQVIPVYVVRPVNCFIVMYYLYLPLATECKNNSYVHSNTICLN